MRAAPHPFTLRQLQYVVAVAEARNFRRAAELCRVSQPSLSAQVAELEDGLGVRLFERDRRGVLLTAAGEELVVRARRLLTEADDLVEQARGLGDPLSGALRLGVIPTISPYLLPDLAPALARALPKLRLLWTEDKTEALRRALAAGTLDGALMALNADLNDLPHEVIGEDPFVLAAPMNHPLGSPRGPAKLEELRDADVLLLDDGHCLRDQALSVCTRARAHELDFRATSLPTLVQMVAGGAGVTLLPSLAVATETRRAALKVRPFGAPSPRRTLALVWRARSAREPALRAVAKVASTTLQKTRPGRAPDR